MSPPLRWQSGRLKNLTTEQLYQILAARSAVFVVEQKSLYQDCDGLDGDSWHLVAWDNQTLAGYLRVIDPGHKFPEPRLGRVLTMPPYRRQGLAKQLVQRALEYVHATWPGQGMRMTAQTYLIAFYQGLGFSVTSPEFLINDIPHVEMVLDLESLSP